MTNKAIARVLKETAALVELTGGNAFRARALSGAARTLDRMEEPAADRLAAGTLTDAGGIGEGLRADIEALLARGSFDLRDELLGAVPPGLLDVLRVKGLGPKKARRLWKELDLTTLDELERAAAADRLTALSGFGKKTQTNVLENVRLMKKYSARRRYADAVQLAAPVLEALRQAEGVRRAAPAGELRRTLETVGRLDLLAAADAPQAVRAALKDYLPKDDLPGNRPEPQGNDLVLEGTLPDDFPLHVQLVPAAHFGTRLWWATGSSDHCAAFEETYGAPEMHADEAAVYEAAGLPFILPELREDLGELEAAAEGRLPALITTDDLRGSLHNHSTYSDGAHTLRAMAEAARALGLSYFGICDHSQSLAVANGLSPARVAEQRDEIRRLNDELASDGGPPFRVFSGIESDILADGALDYDDDVLASLDFVVASIHSGFSMTEDEATDRLVRAIENPHTTILGHATGRLLLEREGYAIDPARIIAACADHGVAIELNANPHRLDMDWRHLRAATEQGVLVAINPDAHSTEELQHVRWGVAAARKAWLTPAQCLNAKPLEDFAAWIGK